MKNLIPDGLTDFYAKENKRKKEIFLKTENNAYFGFLDKKERDSNVLNRFF